MARAGYALREKWRMEAAADKLCQCGHRMGDHFELQDVLVRFTLDDGTPSGRFERHPDHVVGEFHCNHDDCDCVITR